MITNLLAGMPSWAYWLIALGVLIVIAVVICLLLPFGLWFRALVSGAHISMARMIGMKFRQVDIHMIVNAYISARKAGLNLSCNELEAHYMAGGDVNKVVDALISAHSAKIPLDVDTAKAIDLAGRDVHEAIKSTVKPKIIESGVIAAISKDGIELRVKVRVTVKTNISRLIGGAGEETILARVGEGIVTTVGEKDYRTILEKPDLISQTVQSKNLDTGTAFEIISIDVADIDVGKNVGAQLSIDQAEAEKKVAQAKAEEAKAAAEAEEKKMIAETQRMRAQVVLAEAELPKAMADAFRQGQLGIMDYYRMQNLQADTTMRKSIAGPSDNKDVNDKENKRRKEQKPDSIDD